MCGFTILWGRSGGIHDDDDVFSSSSRMFHQPFEIVSSPSPSSLFPDLFNKRTAMNSTDTGHFFQSDQDLEAQARRAYRLNYTRGAAIPIQGKAIGLAVKGDEVFVASATHALLRVNLQVFLLSLFWVLASCWRRTCQKCSPCSKSFLLFL